MSEEKSWTTWKTRWKSTEEDAIDIVKEIFRLKGTSPVDKKKLERLAYLNVKDGLGFAIELGWLKDCLNETYKVTVVGLMMLSHRIKG